MREGGFESRRVVGSGEQNFGIVDVSLSITHSIMESAQDNSHIQLARDWGKCV
jgi:hypothetical protein